MNIKQFIESKYPEVDILKISDDEYRNYYRLLQINDREIKNAEKKQKKEQDLNVKDKKTKISDNERHELLQKQKEEINKKLHAVQYKILRSTTAKKVPKISDESKQYRSYRLRSNAKSIKFQLSQELFQQIIESDCTYCGTSYCNGVDRVNSKEGYTVENSVPCCFMCNHMKYTHTVEKFQNHIKKIYNHLFNQE